MGVPPDPDLPGSEQMLQGPYRFAVAENQFYLLEDDDLDRVKNRTVSAAGNNGLVAGGVDHAVALAGISAGPAMISFDLAPDPLAADSSRPWEDVAAFDYTSTLGVTHLATAMGPDEESDDLEAYEVNLAFNGPGNYRMRLHAQGRTLHPDGVQEEDEPIAEHYLLQVWPTTS
ncbi:hypothetical protein GCM10010329_77300 [Streptomyces spiroverticillatus]|uniref:Uncharacterized protein n=1 Tax=Streptomyces finlayi TaxID=67296 RepID=A0A918X5J2_9ACTN|nr:hypothetical protein GCM10010329_77300 [Streptomyces spiroverticillatus]GHD13925.1 hypothetical protein GCM10010334_72710 [Streptomyces finlayi]